MAAAVEDPQSVRSRRTRACLLGAMRALLEERGFEALTMGAVAERAGVTRRTVYLHFASRTDMVTQLFDYVAEQEGLVESQRPVWEAPDAVTALDEWARHLARYHPQVLSVDRTVQQVRRVDPDAARHYKTVVDRQRAAVRKLATRLHAEGRLAPPWTVDSAADMIWALASSEIIERLVVERRWSRHKLAEYLALVLRSALVAAPGED
jgi:AcrR family transcriptional regulator